MQLNSALSRSIEGVISLVLGNYTFSFKYFRFTHESMEFRSLFIIVLKCALKAKLKAIFYNDIQSYHNESLKLDFKFPKDEKMSLFGD